MLHCLVVQRKAGRDGRRSAQIRIGLAERRNAIHHSRDSPPFDGTSQSSSRGRLGRSRNHPWLVLQSRRFGTLTEAWPFRRRTRSGVSSPYRNYRARGGCLPLQPRRGHRALPIHRATPRFAGQSFSHDRSSKSRRVARREEQRPWGASLLPDPN